MLLPVSRLLSVTYYCVACYIFHNLNYSILIHDDCFVNAVSFITEKYLLPIAVLTLPGVLNVLIAKNLGH